jgi:Glu-tRNA(Gln) amidotransferase subunit E-like FAD-binding protein
MSLENELETLAIILGKMKDQYSLCKETLVKQRAAIISNNTTELTDILTQLDGIEDNIMRLDSRRIYNIEVLARNANLETKTISNIVKAYPEFDGKKLETVASELKKIALEVKTISESNSQLIEISRSIIKETMKVIMTQNTDPRDRAWRTYGNGGAYSRTVTREPVHLVNRRG